MLAGIKARAGLLSAFLSPQRQFEVPLWELCRRGVFKPPCTQLGPRVVERIEAAGDDYCVHLRGVRTPFYWPRQVPMYDLYKVVTESFYDTDWHFYEVPETRVAPGDVVLDCGAAEGIFALRVLERAGRILAFEPLSLFGRTLTRTFAEHPKVQIHSVALGAQPGQAFLDGTSLYGVVNHTGAGVSVPIKTIDQVVGEDGSRVDYIKGDLEGYEMAVLQGAAETIRRETPKIAFTVYHPGNDWREIVRFVRDLVPGYQWRVKGLSNNDGHARPVMVHLWCPDAR